MLFPRIRHFHRIAALRLILVALGLLASVGHAQEPTRNASSVAESSLQPVPSLVRWQGVLAGHAGEMVPLRFSIYATEGALEPLWSEQQSVQLDPKGQYTVLLGVGSAIGLPHSIFIASEPRWLAVSVDDREEPRTLLTSVPYAMKAADAETLGGHSSSSFVSRDELAASLRHMAADIAANMAAQAFQPLVAPTGGGTPGSLALWTSPSALGSSALIQVGTGAAAKIGMATNAPAALLDVAGTLSVRGNARLGTGASATAAAGVNSPNFQLSASSYSSGTAAAIAQNFVWQAQAAGNNTATPSAKLALLFGAGKTAPAPTGLSVAPTGVITFAPAQTFPGVGTGTLTGVTAGTGLTGGGSSGNVTLSLDSNKVPQLSTFNTFASGAAFGGESSWTGSSTDWMMVVTNSSMTSKGTILGQANGNELAIEGASPSGTALLGSTNAGIGVIGQAYAEGKAAYFWSQANTVPNTQIISAGQSDGLQISVHNGNALTSTSMNGYGGYFSNNSTYQATVYAANAGNGNAGSFNNNSVSRVALAGVNASTDPMAIATYGSVSAGKAIYGISTSGTGLYGTTTTGTGVVGYSDSGVGISGSTTSGTGIVASSTASLSTSLKVTTNWIGAFIQQLGTSHTASDVGGVPSLWADTGGNGGTIALAATGDNVVSGLFLNNSAQYPTLSLNNYSSGGTGSSPFGTLMAAGAKGVCGFGVEGNLTCTGQVKSVVTTASARQVETYSVQSSENWIEDYGSGQLEHGKAVIQLDPAFLDIANTEVAYHVFLTSEGEAEPLYITSKTTAGFEVREAKGGASAIAFDYRIVAKRRGAEAQRLVDVTGPIRAAMEAARPRNSSPLFARPSTETAGGPLLTERK